MREDKSVTEDNGTFCETKKQNQILLHKIVKHDIKSENKCIVRNDDETSGKRQYKSWTKWNQREAVSSLAAFYKKKKMNKGKILSASIVISQDYLSPQKNNKIKSNKKETITKKT